MALPTGSEKTYLEITPAEGGFAIQAEGQHAAELRALFQQHGITCPLHPEASPGKDELAFTWEVKVSEVREILEAYKSPEGVVRGADGVIPAGRVTEVIRKTAEYLAATREGG